MYTDNSILSKYESAFAKAYRSSSREVVTEFDNFSVIKCPSLTFQLDLFDSTNSAFDEVSSLEQNHPNDRLHYA